ncbi:MAG: hypothetical protein IPM59_14600 [Chloracidobacterium sp.]|nr:hypothetical protein [Chloracidobacterium sp.]
MQGTPKEKPSDGPPAGDPGADDAHESSYYYDDAHGYESYEPDDEEEGPDPEPGICV